MANEKSSNEFGRGLRTVTLTNVQWNKLYIYLLTTTNPDGSAEYLNAAGNAKYLRELERDLSEIAQKIR